MEYSQHVIVGGIVNTFMNFGCKEKEKSWTVLEIKCTMGNRKREDFCLPKGKIEDSKKAYWIDNVKDFDEQAWEDISSQKNIFKAQKYFRNKTERCGYRM